MFASAPPAVTNHVVKLTRQQPARLGGSPVYKL